MQIDEKLLSRLEKLSALQIIENREEIILELNEIVSFVENLNELDLNSQEVAINAIKGETPLRTDKIKANQVIDQILNCAPQTQEHFFIVPKIIE
ncbi:Asp-tRNA(Asn)/Glu-tRNA(Gln) amidotransferase subunit GatC [Campylobacter hepaticus]|uniref:Aspartyl/glutamyl-tRNA(Asn/Gln) amidotransferase subunit C n=1 Tax=Campylobacter hepaticus TaxID=1813019 RepID=A0A424Z315_9BACT|nr:Asp-tRNA(Asn)/Glu-tRNA(Gln) amidotransferase subunit GatC [Campylobacter hepaticus]MDX2323230.1 Asp-tRNA(Asn)/Glu-tRNA(Gln) amidotransferase subunit GatC [Campylobacter hepaticus]MDX2331076.1 Asp-tRNA(Asn)/Glu-tRNA(Gln) amidotransferase subunit GatC [Campylobacter hepaticus]MDX2332398.1 Asp-tRNA(Asn)/Glu-tRNA(Gln) amidotransferase subunit GatC [Campylobacter hepaticus]MDX2371599.1 Asp-tRNA(Asn)/Glu-tRNA(Gln) amidotransferase subunit GatC [Campylobacter hepaticus]MDX2396941.1 Asp-tRNA(Asn)/G